MASDLDQKDHVSYREGQNYTLTRRAGKLETVYILYNEFGVQSSITSAATFRSKAAAPLTREVLIPALKQLITEHYALRVVAVNHVPDGAPEKEELWEGQICTMDLDRIVEFVDIEADLQTLIEATHNEWLDNDDRQLPLWRLKVVNGRHVIWYYNHCIADGLSGYAFQRGLLRILNSGRSEQSQDPIFSAVPIDPPRRWNVDFPKSLSILIMIWDIIAIYVLRLLFRSSLLFGDLPADSKPAKWTDRRKLRPRCKTRLHTLRIPSKQMNALLSCCKSRGVTFGAFLHTVAISTAAKDLYPKARFGLTAMPIDLRRFTVPAQSPDSILNSVTSNMRFQRMRPYREAVTGPPISPSKSICNVYVDPEKFWNVARSYRKHLDAKLDKLDIVNGLLSFDLIGPATKDIFANVMPGMWLYQRYYLSISNLGAFKQPESTGEDNGEDTEWRIEDIQFSAAAVGSRWGFVTPVLNVAALKGGDCVINATIEEGTMPDATIQTFLGNIMERLELLIHLEHCEGR